MIRLRNFQARLYQRLFHKRIAHLNRRAQLALLLKRPRRQPRRAVYAIPPRVSSHQHQQVARPPGRRPRQLVRPQQPHAHRVHQRVARIRIRKDYLAAHIRHADAVPVARYARYHAPEQVAVARVRKPPKPQRVQQRDRPRAHCEDVSHNPPHARCRPLTRLYRRRVIVRLDLHHHRKPIAYVHRARVFAARPHQQARAFARQHTQQRPGMFIPAMLAPQRPEQP